MNPDLMRDSGCHFDLKPAESVRVSKRPVACNCVPFPVCTHGKWNAITRYRTLGHSYGFSWLEIEMTTGVTHQIRVHLAAVGHAIVGDSLYGANATETFGLERH